MYNLDMPDPTRSFTGCEPEAIALLPALLAAFKLIALHAPLIFFSFVAARAVLGNDRLVPRASAAMLIYFLSVNIACWLSPGLSYPRLLVWAMVYGAAGVAIGFFSKQDEKPAGEEALSVTAIAGALIVLVFMASLIITAILNPRFDHDPLTYQLHFAAAWLKSGGVSIVPTPFGDPSQAYGPSLVSMYYLWLIAPLGTDMLAQTGQWAFLILAVLAACGLASELGAKKDWSWTAGVLMFTAPLLVYEGRSALDDLAVAGFFTGAMYFFLRGIRRGQGADFALGLLSAGLMAGCKYTAVPLILLLTPLAAVAAFKARERRLTAWPLGIAGGVAGGGIWYIRNLIISGNPVFPIRVSIGGNELFPGLYGREEMMAWVFHQEGAHAWLNILSTNLSPALLIIGAIAMIYMLVPVIMGLRPGKPVDKGRQDSISPGQNDGTSPYGQRIHGGIIVFVALTPFLIDRAYWSLMPYQVERFWIPATPVMCAITAAACSRSRTIIILAVVLSYAGLFIPLSELNIGSETWNWIWAALPASAVAGVVLSFVVNRVAGLLADNSKITLPSETIRKFFPAVAISIFIMCITAYGLENYDKKRSVSLLNYSLYGRGWIMTPCPENGATVAYAGSNMPYPLHGPRLKNKVIYIAPYGKVMPLDHVLFKETGYNVPRFLTPEPAPARLKLCPYKWATAIIDSGAGYLFTMRVGRNASINTSHDNGGWPIEDLWARSAPEVFKPVYKDNFTGIYEVDQSAKPSVPDRCFDRPADAMSACRTPSPDCSKFFPRAGHAMKAMGIR
jgi:hypothetical protein